jgi:hypothetical protein
MRLFVPLLLLALAPGAIVAAPVEGLWLTEEDKSLVQVEVIDDELTGRVYALRDPVFRADENTGRDGQLRVDMYNEDENYRERRIVGLKFLWGFSFEDGKWRHGRAYDPESGKTYRAVLNQVLPDVVELRGYIGTPLFGRTTSWRRVSECEAVVQQMFIRTGVTHPVCEAEDQKVL